MSLTPKDGWRLFLWTVFYSFIWLRPGWRVWLWPRIVYHAWTA
jgi:hypothetical protein